MSALPQTQATFSADDYLTWEATQSERHEFLDGEIFAMAGAEDWHITVCLNIAMALRQHLHGTPCRTFMADMKVQAEAASSYFYPDIVVTCSATDAQSRQIKREPLLIVEVLSPGTEAYDRGEKFQRYRQIASLVEYALVDIEHRRVDVFRKQSNGLWLLHPLDAGVPLVLASVDLTVDVETLYAEIDL